MEALDALIAEENAALADPLPPEYKRKYGAISTFWLPHVKHQPFFEIVRVRGYQALVARGGFLDAGYFLLLEGLKIMAEGIEREGLTKISEIEKRLNVSIPPETFDSYLVGFAERMINYVKKQFHGFDLENADLSGLIKQGVDARYALLKVLDPDADKLEDIAGHLIEEDDMLSFFSAIMHVRAFYQDAKPHF